MNIYNLIFSHSMQIIIGLSTGGCRHDQGNCYYKNFEFMKNEDFKENK